MRHAFIVTIYYETPQTIKLCSRLGELGAENIVVVCDGCELSFDFENELISLGCHLIKLKEKHGKGYSIREGIKFAHDKLYHIDGYITADADGQHRAEDVIKVSRALELRPDTLIIGKRDMKRSGAAIHLRFFNKFASTYFKIVTGVNCKDALSGLRGIPAELYDLIMETKGNRYDFEMNFLTRCADRKVPFYNVNILSVYSKDQVSNYRIFRDTYLIYITPLRFATASFGCAVIDVILFTLLTYLMPASLVWNVAIATVLARIISGGINFIINRKMIFKNDGKAHKQAERFFILFFCIMILSMVFVSLLSFVPIPVTVIKIIVDLLLWTVNYTVQRKWVFKEGK